ncbi:HD domain-containing protein [bacterium]|nr:HD domain-containing protein [bacterium]
MIKKIPKHIIEILRELEKAGYEAYIVGGCARDLLMGRKPNDWDITTNARPEEIMAVFGKENSFYENNFGTVGIKAASSKQQAASKIANSKIQKSPSKTTQSSIGKKKKEETNKNENLTKLKTDYEIVEITTFRIESKYSDKRRPDKVKFAKTLEEDLSRRDFTMNAIALRIIADTNLRTNTNDTKSSYEVIDLFGGQKDIKDKIIRAVGDADERFDEDALRMMRAIRFASTLNQVASIKKQVVSEKTEKNDLNWKIEKKTFEAIKKNAKNLKYISQERIRDELSKIILSGQPAEGIDTLRKAGLLTCIIPELEKGVGMRQNRHHIYTIYKHGFMALKYCPSKKLETRLAALLHDIAKPQTKRGEGYYATFYNHDHVGARVAEKILKRLRFPGEVVQKVKILVDNHMFYYNPEEVGEASVRKLIKKVGLENMKDLIDLRVADRLGSGVPKAKPYKLRYLEYLIDKVSRDPISVKMLKVNGNDLIKNLDIKPGPKIGAILDVLLAEVIEDTSKNSRSRLLKRAKELINEDISRLRELAKEKIEEKKEEEDEELKGKHWVS